MGWSSFFSLTFLLFPNIAQNEISSFVILPTCKMSFYFCRFCQFCTFPLRFSSDQMQKGVKTHLPLKPPPLLLLLLLRVSPLLSTFHRRGSPPHPASLHKPHVHARSSVCARECVLAELISLAAQLVKAPYRTRGSGSSSSTMWLQRENEKEAGRREQDRLPVAFALCAR